MTSSKPNIVTTLSFPERPYYSYFDEKYFYAWLESIDGVMAVRGTTERLCVDFRGEFLSRDGAYELIALFARYSYALAPIRPYINPEHFDYFRDPKARWYEEIFGQDASELR